MNRSRRTILQVSASDRMGGAEAIALALFKKYRERGHDSYLAVGRKQLDDPHVLRLDHDRLRGAWARAALKAAGVLSPVENVRGVKRVQLAIRQSLSQRGRWGAILRGEEDFDFPATAALLKLAPTRPNVLHLHNLHTPGGYFDLRALPMLSNATPTFITLHDAWLFSGHCAHSFACERWKIGCGTCPDLTIYPAVKRDATALNWERKRNILEGSQLHVCTPSEHLMKRARQSILAPAVVSSRVIANGIDLKTFYPGEQAAARAGLGLPKEEKILLFSANGVRQNPFKDFATLERALRRCAAAMPGERLLFLALGEALQEETFGTARLRFVPFERDGERMADYYRAADVYVHAARADTFPTSVLEALACGRAVVATGVGGIPEQVVEGVTGHLVPPADDENLANAVVALLKDTRRLNGMGEAAATDARNRFDVEMQVARTLEWYEEVLSARGEG